MTPRKCWYHLDVAQPGVKPIAPAPAPNADKIKMLEARAENLALHFASFN